MFIQLLANGLVTGSVIALAAAGVSIVYLAAPTVGEIRRHDRLGKLIHEYYRAVA